MKKQRTSYAFLMEMLWVCGFFALSACIFVLAFVKADQLSRNAENLNHAVLLSQNAAETTFSQYEARITGEGSAEESQSFYYDRNWTPSESESDASFSMCVSTLEDRGFLTVTVSVSDAGGEEIYTLEGCRSLKELPETTAHAEGRQP